ncbi:Photolyase PhrB-like [Candidatus Nanopelagicaceae bacterium]
MWVMAQFTRALYLPFDQLNANHGVLRGADKKSDLLVLVESQSMISGADWHPERLFFLISSARHFAAELRADGFEVRYIKASNTVAGLKEIKNEFPSITFHAAEQSSYRLSRSLSEFGVETVENDFFLTPRNLFASWAGSQKSYLMENFYRKQRVRLNVLMEGDAPIGGQWNYDKDNRLPPPKNYIWPAYLEHGRDEIDLEVAADLKMQPTQTWATTRAGALAQLKYFIKNHFEKFGPYEDAMALDSWALHHSLLSPYLNNGLLHASEVIDAACASFYKGAVPIESAEAFVRQIIGWREYINGMYWFLGEDYRNHNQLGADRDLLPLFTDPSKTSMKCMKSIVQDIKDRSWVHHIPRLMVLSNLALITGTNPQQFLDWMRREFIDAADWVMVPNVIGMAVHADGGQLMSKPYAAGGAYISRMSNYCKGCSYNPKLRVGDDACPFTTLYWDFLDRHKETFVKNHRMSQQVNGLKRLSDLDELKHRAQEVLSGLEKGEI